MNAQEKDFAYKVRHALNERLDDLPQGVEARLAKARSLAVARKRKHEPVHVAVPGRVFTGATGGMFGNTSWLGNLGLPALVLALGLMGIFHYEQQRQIRETAAVDMAMLSDELPPAAYTDMGFSAYLERRGMR